MKIANKSSKKNTSSLLDTSRKFDAKNIVNTSNLLNDNKNSFGENKINKPNIAILKILISKISKVVLVSLILSAMLLNSFNYKIYSTMPTPVTNQSSFVSWLENTGRHVYSKYHGYVANYDVYKNYNLLTYGTPQNVSGNRYDTASKQYASHGFSYDEYVVTNTYFPDDTTGISDPRKWKNINLGQDAQASWMRLTSREKEHIHNSKLYYKGNNFSGMSFKSLALTELQCIVTAIPSWSLGFALYTNHYNSSNQLRYGTLHGDGIGSITLSGSVKTSPNASNRTYEISSNQEYIDITFTNTSSISSYAGLAKSSDISRGGIIFNGKSFETTGSGPWNYSQTIRYTRIGAVASKDFSRQISLKTTIWVVSALGDLVSKDITTNFTIIEKAKSTLTGIISIKGAISLFDGKKTMMGYTLPLNPKRFLCLEKITLRIDFKGEPMPSTVTFYPLGSTAVTVFVSKISSMSGFAQIVYPMGILPSTLNWRNARINTPYSCYASSYIGSNRTDYSITGIEITGDIYDLVYLHAPITN